MKQLKLSNSPQNKVCFLIQFSNRSNNNNRSALHVLKWIESLTCTMLTKPPVDKNFTRNYFHTAKYLENVIKCLPFYFLNSLLYNLSRLSFPATPSHSLMLLCQNMAQFWMHLNRSHFYHMHSDCCPLSSMSHAVMLKLKWKPREIIINENE